MQDAHGGSGVLVLSRFTGAAEELREAVSCNPFDVDGLSRRFEHALELEPTARRRATRGTAQRVDHNDVHAWLDQQLSAIDAAVPPSGHARRN